MTTIVLHPGIFFFMSLMICGPLMGIYCVLCDIRNELKKLNK